jgi:hypothetical protein
LGSARAAAAAEVMRGVVMLACLASCTPPERVVPSIATYQAGREPLRFRDSGHTWQLWLDGPEPELTLDGEAYSAADCNRDTIEVHPAESDFDVECNGYGPDREYWSMQQTTSLDVFTCMYGRHSNRRFGSDRLVFAQPPLERVWSYCRAGCIVTQHYGYRVAP